MNKVKEIVKEIERHGGQAYVVGGYVRDHLMKKPSKDIDVEVYGIQPNVLEAILMKFGNPKLCGESFGVYKLEEYDFALPRKERKNGKGYTGFDVEIDPYMSLSEAVSRRDLTINALFMEPLTSEIIDLVGGINDINAGILRHVSERFAEDPLRILRVSQFSARFNFEVDDETVEFCESLVPELKDLPKERIYTEIEKLLMKAAKPSIGLRFLNQIGALTVIFPELHSLQYVAQGKDHHSEGDAFVHTILTLDAIPMEERTIEIMLALLFHDLGKLVVESEVDGDSIHFKGHAEEGLELCKEALLRITNETNLISEVLNLIKHHMRPYDLMKNLNTNLVRRLAVKVDFEKLMKIHKADQLGRGVPKDISYIDDMLFVYNEVKNEIKPIIRGKDLIALGLTPGKHFGYIIKKAFEAQLDGAFNTVEDGITWLTELKGIDCRLCNGWGQLFIKAGFPNEVQSCPVCKGEYESGTTDNK